MRAKLDEVGYQGKAMNRPLRVLGWTLGSVVAVAALVFLVGAGALAWHFGVSAPNRQEAIAETERQMAREWAAEAESALASAAADGRLTDDEIRKAVGGAIWDVGRASTSWMVRANFDGSDPLCFSFEITLPLGPGTDVTRTELPACPVIKPV